MQHCQNKTCRGQRWQDSCYCELCFIEKWGPEEPLISALPDCLINVTFEYLDVKSLLVKTKCDFRPIMKHCPLTIIAQMLLKLWDEQQLLYLAERFCFSNAIWAEFLKIEMNPWRCLLRKSLQVVIRFSLAQECIFDGHMLDCCTDEESLYWFVSTNLSAQKWMRAAFEAYTVLNFLIPRIVRWNAKKLLQWFIDNGFFADQIFTWYALDDMVANVEMFAQVFYLHFPRFVKDYHDKYVRSAISNINIALLELFIQVPLFSFSHAMCELLIINGKSSAPLIRFIAKHKLARDKWFQEFDFDIDIDFFEKLLQNGSLDVISNSVLSQYFFRHYNTNTFIQDHKTLFFRILPRLTFLGKHPSVFLHFMVHHWNLADLRQFVQHPVASQHITFANLRRMDIPFLPRMFARNPSTRLLQWIETWRDCEDQRLALCDIYTKNKRLPRDVRQKWAWFQAYFIRERSLMFSGVRCAYCMWKGPISDFKATR